MPMQLPLVRVNDERTRLQTVDGQPFFWLADTAWQMTHVLDRDEIDLYLQTRARQRFNVVQVVCLAEFGGLVDPNAYGHYALKDFDPTQPQDAYFEHIDWAIARAAELRIYVALLPTWGDKFNPKWHKKDPRKIFTPENAHVYGQWIGRRYKDVPSIVWVLGGDRHLETDEHRQIVRAMAEGIKKSDGGAHAMTFHPPGGSSSSQWVQDEAWLDFHMLQSGHTGRDPANWNMIAADLAREPKRPVLDGEPCYEDHPCFRPNWSEFDGWFNDYDVRKAAWRALFAGACGHTYGCHDVWQFFDPVKRDAINRARTPWQDAINLPGAYHMQYVRALADSRPANVGKRWESLYITAGKDAGFFRNKSYRVALFDPRNGEMTDAGVSNAGKEVVAQLPSGGPDWVVVLDQMS